MRARLPIFLSLLLLVSACGLSSLFSQSEDARFGIESKLVQVPVTVIDEEGKLYGELQQQNFKLRVDGEQRPIENFAGGKEPLTMVLLLEHSQVVNYLLGEVLRPAAIFTSQIMQEDDFAAIVSFAAQPRLITDFTANRQKLMNGVNRLAQSPPGFNESSLFDAVNFVLRGGTIEDVPYKGLAEIKGRTGVLLVATGVDTLSRFDFDEIRRIVANSGVPIYSIGVGEMAYIRAEPYMSGLERMNYQLARNRLETISEESGGHFYSVRFSSALDGVLESIGAMLRYQYMLGFRPQSGAGDERRKIEVLVDIDGDGQFNDEKLDLNYRRYYYPPGAVEKD